MSFNLLDRRISHLLGSSDIDLAIAGTEEFSIVERLNISLSINMFIRKEVDLIDLLQARGAILHDAMIAGQVLYCHNS